MAYAMKLKKPLAFMGLLVVLSAVFVACRSSPTPEPAATPVDLEQLNTLVQQTVEEAVLAASGLESLEELRKVMETAAAAPVLTKEAVEELVSKAVADSLAALRPSVPSVSPPVLEPKKTIVFSGLNWTSAQLQNRIAMFIAEHGFDYPVDTLSGDTNSLWPMLLNGDADVTMEVWLPNQQSAWDEAVSVGSVIPLGKSLDDNWQSAFVVPTYVVEDNPGLQSVQDLREFKDLFVTPDSGGKAQLVSCVAGWRCQEINEQVVLAYGLDDVVELVTPDSSVSLFASLRGAYEKREPWLGYLWGPTKPAAVMDLTRLEEPACPVGTEPGPGNGCAYPTARVLIAVHPTLLARAPQVVEFLRRWDFTAESQIAVESWMADNEASLDEAVAWFLENDDVWTQWVPPNVAKNVNDALAVG